MSLLEKLRDSIEDPELVNAIAVSFSKHKESLEFKLSKRGIESKDLVEECMSSYIIGVADSMKTVSNKIKETLSKSKDR